jgi:hypothetical protein
MASTDHVPRLCRVCDAPLTAYKLCTKCGRDWGKPSDPFANDLKEIMRHIFEDTR